MSYIPFDINEIKVLIQDNLANGIIEKSLSELKETDLARAVIEYGGLTDPIGQLESWLAQQLQSFGNWLVQSFQAIISPIVSAINTVSSYVAQGFASLSSTITQSFQSFASQISTTLASIQSAFQSLGTAFQSFASQLGSSLQSFFSQISSALTTGFSQLSSAFQSLGSQIQGAFSGIVSAIYSLGSQVQSALSNFANVLTHVVFPSIQNWITSVVNSVISGLQSFASQAQTVFSNIVSGIESFGKTVSSVLGTFWNDLQGAFTTIGKYVSGFVSSIEKGFEQFVKDVQSFGGMIQSTLSSIGTMILQGFVDIGKGFETLFSDVQKALSGFVQFMEGIPNMLSEIPSKVFDAVYKAFLDFLKATGIDKAFTIIIDFFKNVAKFFENLGNNPIIKAIIKDFELFASGIENAFTNFYNIIIGIYHWIAKALQSLATDFMNTAKSLASGFLGLGKGFTSFVVDIAKYGISSLYLPVAIESLPILATMNVFKTEPYIIIKSGIDPVKVAIPDLVNAFGAISLISASVFGVVYGIGALIEKLGSATGSQEIDLSPLGLGVKLRLNLGKLLEPIGDLLEKVGDEIGRGLALSGSLAFMEPLRYIWRYVWWLTFYAMGMGNMPFELPSHGELFDIARRFDVTQNINYIANTMIYRGFPYWFIAKTIALPTTFTSIDVANQALGDFKKEIQNNYITVVDKFGNTRIIPIAPLFELPTTHDLVEFMLRDLFLPASAPPAQQPALAYQSFVKAMWARGVPPDVAYMYYLRAYELPSATEVWNFTMRALSGFAWYVPPSEVQTFAESEAKIINAFIPQVPAKLNFQYDLALLAMAEYQKWHGRAHFAWINDPTTGKSYTSDAWLIIDQSAHLLDRTDIEHLVRHGIWDYYQKKYGITNETTMYDVLGKVVEPNATSPIQIYTDYVTNVLMARGFHPYVAPLIALRAVFDVTTASKTLLRTGLLNLIRENIELIPIALQLMSHFFDVSVHVAYFDMYNQKWVTGWLNAPVRYLDPEAKLLVLRALMDKVNTYMRNMFRALLAGVRDYLVSINDSINYMVGYVTDVLDKYYAPLYKSITGVEMHLTWDSAFNNAIAKYFEVEQLIGTFRRIRYYARYALYRILGIIAMGLIPRTQITNYVDQLVTLMKETPQARDVFMFISNLIYTSSILRNYETMIRVWLGRHAMTVDQALQTLLAQNIDPDYARALVNAYASPYYPTIAQLIVMSEYNPAFLGKLGQVIQLMRIPQDWVQVWQDYAFIRAYVRWFIRALNEVVTVVSRIPLSVKIIMPLTQGNRTIALSDVVNDVFKQAQAFGFDSTKLNFVKELIDFRYVLTQYRNSIPTPWHALNLTYYLPDPDTFIDNLSQNWIISQYGVSLIKTLAKFRKYGRWMFETVYWAVRAFARGYMAGQDLYQFLQSLQAFGLSKYDIEMIRNWAFAMSCYYGACQYPW